MDETIRHTLTRRAAMKGALKAGAYVAPVVLSTTTVSAAVAAATPPPPSTIVSFLQDYGLTATGARATFDVSATPLNAAGQPVGAAVALNPFTTDSFGVGGMDFPLTLDTSVVKAVLLTYVLHVTPTPPPAATVTSMLVAAVAPVNGMPPPARLVGLVVQEPTVTACQIGPLTTFTETLDVALINAQPNTAYDFYAQPSGVVAPVKVGTATTTAQGNTALYATSPVVTVASVPTSVTVTAVLAGAPATPALYTLTASGARLMTIDCTALQIAQHGPTRARALVIIAS